MSDIKSPVQNLYKCPRCNINGEYRFPSLETLTLHLKEEHSQLLGSPLHSPTSVGPSTAPLSPHQSATGEAKGTNDFEWAWPEAGLRRKANDLERLLCEINRHAAVLDRRTEDEATAVSRLTDELTKMKKRNWSLTDALHQAQGEVRHMRRALTERQLDSVVKQQCEKMVQQISDLKNDLESKQCALSRGDNTVHLLNEERDQLENQIGELSAQVQYYFEQVESLQLQLEDREKCVLPFCLFIQLC